MPTIHFNTKVGETERLRVVNYQFSEKFNGYLPATVELEPGKYRAQLFDPTIRFGNGGFRTSVAFDVKASPDERHITFTHNGYEDR